MQAYSPYNVQVPKVVGLHDKILGEDCKTYESNWSLNIQLVNRQV